MHKILSTPDLLCRYLEELSSEIMMPRFRQLGDGEMREKSAGDYVTIVDIEMERELTGILQNIIPGSLVLGEEAVSENPEMLSDAKHHEYVWLVDPLDGTNNFTRGVTRFCVMVALLCKGRIIQSWIYNPVDQIHCMAQSEEGAYYGDEKLICSNVTSFDEMEGQVSLNAILDKDHRLKIKSEQNKVFANVDRLGCAGYDFVQHARNLRHFSLYNRLAPWDIAPGRLILEEAGGKIAVIDTEELEPFATNYKILSSVSAANWHDLKKYFGY
ncbi:MAG: inositol monophosphatase [Alphaproteobacteria bacterium]|nr:inositol monophosphatase [Alphaproteobacteria bacterium]